MSLAEGVAPPTIRIPTEHYEAAMRLAVNFDDLHTHVRNLLAAEGMRQYTHALMELAQVVTKIEAGL